jgi:hypothetical protein
MGADGKEREVTSPLTLGGSLYLYVLTLDGHVRFVK